METSRERPERAAEGPRGLSVSVVVAVVAVAVVVAVVAAVVVVVAVAVAVVVVAAVVAVAVAVVVAAVVVFISLFGYAFCQLVALDMAQFAELCFDFFTVRGGKALSVLAAKRSESFVQSGSNGRKDVREPHPLAPAIRQPADRQDSRTPGSLRIHKRLDPLRPTPKGQPLALSGPSPPTAGGHLPPPPAERSPSVVDGVRR